MLRARRWTGIPEIEAGDRVLDLGAAGDSVLKDHFRSASGVFLTADVRSHNDAVSHDVESHLVADFPSLTGYRSAVYEPPQREAKDRVFELIDGTFSALDIGGTFWLAGRRNRGVESYARRLEQVFGNVRQMGRADRTRVYQSTRTADTAGAPPIDPSRVFAYRAPSGSDLSFRARAGVFSADDVDPGSRLLIETVGPVAAGSVLDVGCGAGTIGQSIISGDSSAHLVQVDASILATSCAEANVVSNGLDGRCETLTSDLYDEIADRRFDLIVSNPPFHEGSAVSHPLIQGAARRLTDGGRLCLVVMREGPYLKALEQSFGDVEVAARSAPYSILTAKAPKVPVRG